MAGITVFDGGTDLQKSDVTDVEDKVDTSIADIATVDGLHDVPTKDVQTNTVMRDVIGNKNDGHSGTSLYSRIKMLVEHVHGAAMVWPTLADGVALTSGAGDWQLGTITQIVAANDIGSDFDIHQVVVEDYNTADKTYELTLYYGADDTLAGTIRFSSTANKASVDNGILMTPLIPANSRIRAKLAIQDGGSKTAQISIRYHIY